MFLIQLYKFGQKNPFFKADQLESNKAYNYVSSTPLPAAASRVWQNQLLYKKSTSFISFLDTYSLFWT